MLLVKLSRGLKAIESKFLQFTDSGIDRKRVEQVDLSSVPTEKLFITAVEEELTLYKKLYPFLHLLHELKKLLMMGNMKKALKENSKNRFY